MYDKYLISFLQVTNLVDPPNSSGSTTNPFLFRPKNRILNLLEQDNDPATV